MGRKPSVQGEASGQLSHTFYPVRPAEGSSLVTSPLTSPLLRLVPGDARARTPPVVWNPEWDQSFHDDISVRVRITGSSGTVEAWLSLYKAGQERPSEWVDYVGEPDEVFVELWRGAPPYSKPVKDHGADLEGPVGTGAVARTQLKASLGASRCMLRATDPDTVGEPGVIGEFVFEYVVVTPYLGPCCERAADEPQPDKAPRLAGHRGLGSSKTSMVQENTVRSFREATSAPGVTYVELDVQLSQDNVPIIYHDWSVPIPAGSTSGTDKDTRKFIFDMTAEEFQRVPAPKHVAYVPSLTEKANNPTLSASPRTPEPAQMPTLADVCSQLSPGAGLLIEVKYPPPNVQQRLGVPYPDHNTLLDHVLRVLFSEVLEQNMTRPIRFLTFDADLCTMLALKQTKYPVYFLHCETRDGVDCDDADPRTIDIRNGIEFAVSQQLSGMVLFTNMLFDIEGLASDVKARDLQLMSYGIHNRSLRYVQQQFRDGVDGVIADEVVRIAAEIKHS